MNKGILLGALGLLLIEITGFYLFVVLGIIPVNADTKPGQLETWIARKSLRATLKRQVQDQSNPLPYNESNLLNGIKLYAANCLVCHGASDGQPSNIAKGLYQRAPQLARHGVEDDQDGKTYWVIAHGIRMTGMPSFSKSLSQEQIWQITMFLKHMDSLPLPNDAVWKSLM